MEPEKKSSSLLHKADKWITKKLDQPGLDKEQLSQKKIYWTASLAVVLTILILTISYKLIFPQLKILIYYGFFLALVFSQGVIFPIIPFFRSNKILTGIWHTFADQLLVALATFICILLLGGIPYSGGLIFVGVALVFFSLNFWKKTATIAIYVIYVITLILAGILHPYLTVPPEMTPTVNISLYVINLLWISGFATFFVLNFISERIHLEEIKADKLKELDEAKSKFYTNITHEFRTPLTLIKGTLDLIKKEPKRWLDEGSEKIDQNANILLNLVNQMLDLSKLETGSMKKHMVKANINLYIKYIIELFESFASVKKIKLEFIPQDKDLIMDYDPEKLLQILSNLISNALKHTPPSGHITVKTSLHKENSFEITITDSGKGIPGEHLPHIFDRFFRVERQGECSLPGSGLGLAITKELVNLIGGSIKVNSICNKGTTFYISLPYTTSAEHLDLSEVKEIAGKNESYLFSGQFQKKKYKIPNDYNEISGKKPLLLIVDDNLSVIDYLIIILKEKYEILTAINGREGLIKAIEYIPDIILSDIMMPMMDGITMLDKIKNDFRTSHIPVVMLTAKVDIDSRLKGLKIGADAYISKPFNKEELIVQLQSLTELRIKLKERYSKISDLRLTVEEKFHTEDSFIIKIREIISDNIENELFDIKKLCLKMGMSRTQLYRKFHILTDMTISEYLRSFRLHHARELLSRSHITVSEAAYKTGFKNVSHFSRAFKKEFDINPSQIC